MWPEARCTLLCTSVIRRSTYLLKIKKCQFRLDSESAVNSGGAYDLL